MDDPNAGTQVEWREWGPEAFAEAADAGKPVLLSLAVPWSATVREMDATTFSEPRIAANVNDGFVPIRVDADRAPHVRDRYNMGGFPSTVFLTPEGTIISGATFLGIDGFRGILDSVRGTWDAKGVEAGTVPRAIRETELTNTALTRDIETHMVEQLAAAGDDEFGGWGTDAKFPMPETIDFALVRRRDHALRTLEAIRAHLEDTYDGGFYRYAANRDWSEPRREKLTDENAALIRGFARAYRYTGEESYLEPAAHAIEYLTTDLWTGEAFAGSQAGDDDYYTAEATEREEAAAPPIDETVFADRNALAAEALLTVVAYTDDERADRYATRALEYVVENLVDDGVVTHFETADATCPAGLLYDQARVLSGLTTAIEVTGEYETEATAIADYTLDALQDDHGACRDWHGEGAGLLDSPLYPIDANATLADGLLELGVQTDTDRYREAATDVLGAFADAADRMGVEVASYASAVARALDPLVVEVAEPAGSDLHRAALRIVDHEAIVCPEADAPADGTARVTEDGDVLGAASDPDDLSDLLTDD
jgi:hypothetical protein